MPSAVHTIHKEMGYTYKDFMRLLPKAVGHAEMEIRDNEIHVGASDEKSLQIKLGAESERHIGFFRIPKLPVTLIFTGYQEAEIAATIDRFARTFQKGGG